MTNALDRAYLHLKADCDKWKIQVPKGERIILYNGLAVQVPFYTPKSDCLRKLRKFIKLAEKQHFQATQVSLIEDSNHETR